MTRKKIPDAPVWMSAEARTHYEWLAPKILKEKNFDEIDYPLIWAACDYYGRFLSADKLADKKNYISAYEKLMEKFKKKSVYKETEETEVEEEGREDEIAKSFEF